MIPSLFKISLPLASIISSIFKSNVAPHLTSSSHCLAPDMGAVSITAEATGETREPAKRAVCRGRRLLVLFAKESGSFKSHSPSRVAAAKPLRGQRPRVLHGEAMPIRREGRCQPSGRPQKKPQPKGCGFFIRSTCWHQTPTRPTGLRHGASWSCRRCLPARYPSR